MSEARDDATGRTRPRCRRCGDSILAVTVIGPTEATAVPCGCSVSIPTGTAAEPGLE